MEQTNETTPSKPKRRFARGAPETAKKPLGAPSQKKKTSCAGISDVAPRVTKAEIIVGALSRPQGATIEQMCQATGWQQHSVRGFLAGTVKKKAGVALTSEKADGVRTYRLVASDGASA